MVNREKLKSEADDTRKAIGKSLHIKSSKDLLIFLSFFVFVFLYWYLVNMGEEHEYECVFDVSLRHVPDGMRVTEAPATQLTVKVRDRGERILEYRTRKSMHRLTVNYEDYTPVGGHVVIAGTGLDELLRGPLASSTQILSITPDTLRYCVASAVPRQLPVYVRGTVSTAANHAINRTMLSPDSVKVWAPSVVLDTMQGVWTEAVKADGLTDSVAFELPLESPARGVLMEPSAVTYSVVATPFVEKSIELPVHAYLFPYGAELKTFPSKVRVLFMVSMDEYNSVTGSQFEVVVNYTNLDGAGKARPEVIRQPSCVKSVRIEPAEIDYLIESNGSL